MARASDGVTTDRADSFCVTLLVMENTMLMRIGTESQKNSFFASICMTRECRLMRSQGLSLYCRANLSNLRRHHVLRSRRPPYLAVWLCSACIRLVCDGVYMASNQAPRGSEMYCILCILGNYGYTMASWAGDGQLSARRMFRLVLLT